jgi:hypothetical protein
MAKTKMEFQAEQNLQAKAGRKADEQIERLRMTAPIDPLAIVKSEVQHLRSAGANLGSRYDGKLEFAPSKQLFLLYYNTKYDDGLEAGRHHPRTRFSIAHELGHYFLDEHHKALRGGKAAHISLSEFRTHDSLEREADAFASSLLMPTMQIKPLVNARQLSVPRLQEIADVFDTSIVSTAFRSVRLSHFPCAVARIRDGQVAWTFVSDPAFDAGLYPRRGEFPSRAAKPWANCRAGINETSEDEGTADDWFTIYNNDRIEYVPVTEEYISVPVMNMMLVLLTMDEFEEEDDFDQDDFDQDDD